MTVTFSVILTGSMFSKLAAQSATGITHIADSSYTTASAYQSSKKQYPFITIAEVPQSKGVKEQLDLCYRETADGRRLMLDVFRPRRKKNGRTAVIIIHGGGWRSGNRTQHYALARSLAARGYVCFTPAYTLSTDGLFPAAIDDLKAAVRWTRAHAKQYGIDTMKIAALGFSAGGELAAFLAVTGNRNSMADSLTNVHHASQLNALIDLDGTLSFVHPESGEGDDSKRLSAATLWFGYSHKENPALWNFASPLTLADSLTPPTLFVNSSVERMHAGRDDFSTILRSFGTYVRTQSFSDAPHSFPLFNPWFSEVVHFTDDFLKYIFTSKQNR